MAYSSDVLNYVHASTDGRCHLCRRRRARRSYGRTWEVDHSVPRAGGGTDYLRNLKPACISCNRSKKHGSTRAARRVSGFSRAPLSKKAKENSQVFSAVLGLAVGAPFGPVGALIGFGLGCWLGGQDND
jgi:5-methylcytosine-specific restriction endonuclease McrA